MITNYETAHNFANNVNEGKRAGNLFWTSDWNGNGRTIYSYGYHFPICRIEGETAFFTLRGYSNSTAKHISAVRGALYQNIVYCYNPEGSTSTNFKYWYDSIVADLKKLATARKAEKYVSAIQRTIKQAEVYASAKGVKLPKEIAYFKTFDAERGKAAKIVKEGKRERAEELKRERARKEEERRRAAEKITRWENGERVWFGWKETDSNVPMRITARKGYFVVETAKGVIIPMNAAKPFAQMVVNGTFVEGDILTNYRVREISKNKVRIGCHTFDRAYFDNFAQKVVNFVTA